MRFYTPTNAGKLAELNLTRMSRPVTSDPGDLSSLVWVTHVRLGLIPKRPGWLGPEVENGITLADYDLIPPPRPRVPVKVSGLMDKISVCVRAYLHRCTGRKVYQVVTDYGPWSKTICVFDPEGCLRPKGNPGQRVRSSNPTRPYMQLNNHF